MPQRENEEEAAMAIRVSVPASLQLLNHLCGLIASNLADTVHGYESAAGPLDSIHRFWLDYFPMSGRGAIRVRLRYHPGGPRFLLQRDGDVKPVSNVTEAVEGMLEGIMASNSAGLCYHLKRQGIEYFIPVRSAEIVAVAWRDTEEFAPGEHPFGRWGADS